MRGADKLLEEVSGAPLLRHQARCALATGAEVFVTLAPGHQARRRALDGLAVTVLTVPDADEGLAASIRAGIAALPETADAVMILLADLPDLTPADLALMQRAFAADPAAPILRATAADGTPGHPVILPRRHFPALRALRGDDGARSLLRAAPDLRLIALPGTRATTDLDTPEAWAAWRAGKPGPDR